MARGGYSRRQPGRRKGGVRVRGGEKLERGEPTRRGYAGLETQAYRSRRAPCRQKKGIFDLTMPKEKGAGGKESEEQGKKEPVRERSGNQHRAGLYKYGATSILRTPGDEKKPKRGKE